MNLQQRFITEYCENEILNRGLITEEDFSVEACVLRNVSRIDQGEYLVMRFRGDDRKRDKKYYFEYVFSA